MNITNDLEGLFKQYCNALGIKKCSENDKNLVDAFFEWLNKDKPNRDRFYLEFLKLLNVDFSNSRTMEIGKTINDSLVLPYETRIVTPNEKGFEKYGDRVIVANLHFHGVFPVLLQKKNDMDHVIPIDQYSLVMTQNPYSEEEIKEWAKFPFNFQRIAVGVYGAKDDKDREEKLAMVRDFSKTLDKRSDPSVDEIYTDDNYASVVTTKRSVR